MPNYRSQLLFEYSPQAVTPLVQAGFSETWDMVEADAEAAKLKIRETASRRSQVLTNDWIIKSYRLGVAKPKLNAAGVCFIAQENILECPENLNTRGLAGTGGEGTDWVQMGLLIRIAINRGADEVTFRNYFLLGIPDRWFKTNIQSIPPADRTRIVDWMFWIKTRLKTFSLPEVGCASLVVGTYGTHCIKRPGARQVGRPFFQLRGRRREPTSPS